MTTNSAVGFILAVLSAQALAQPAPGDLNVQWNEGAANCETTPQPPLQVHAYDAQTFILRQSPCADFEANFLYLLVGAERALLIDTGAVADAGEMPLATTVSGLLPENDGAPLPLLVAHTHSHTDHRDGDAQLATLASAGIAPSGLEEIKTFFGFERWPESIAELELGGRTLDVIPTPGHHPAHVVFYDRNTGLLFSGDFLLPGRLLIDDLDAYRASALRVVEFLKQRPVTHILGGHIELDAAGQPYPRGAHHHPNERALQLGREDLLALPSALENFNGFYSRHPQFILSNPIHNLLALVAIVATALSVLVWGVRTLLGRRRTLQSQRGESRA